MNEKTLPKQTREEKSLLVSLPRPISTATRYVKQRLATNVGSLAHQLWPSSDATRQRRELATNADPKTAESGGNAGKHLAATFLAFVVFPTVVALIYYSLFASSVYVVESKITVRDAGLNSVRAQTSSILSKFGITKGDNTAQSTLIVLDYLRSRAVIRDLGGKNRLLPIYGSDRVDSLSRMEADASVEDTWKYWRDKVTASVDTTSNILTLRVRAYTPESALELSNEIIGKSESLINTISRRSREDALSRAKDEVERSVTDLAEVRGQLLGFQQKVGSIDPIDSAKRLIALVSSLTSKKIELESQLATAAETGVAGRPGERSLRTKLDVINSQIADLNDLLASSDAKNSISAQLKEYELLKLREEFAKQIYVIARGSYEQARRDLDRQQLYVATVVRPILPDAALYPRIVIDSGLVMLACAVFWSISVLIVASIRDSTT